LLLSIDVLQKSMEKKFDLIDKKTVAAAKQFLRDEAYLLQCVQEVDRERVFEKLGFPSLFAYVTLRLKLSESTAYAVITVARKAAKVPALQKAVSSGVLNVSQAKRIASVIEPSNASLWIDKAATTKQKELEREVASRLPAPPLQERMRPVGGQMTEIKLVIPERLRKEIERLQEVRGCSIIEAIAFAVRESLERHDPIRKAARNLGKTTKNIALAVNATEQSLRRDQRKPRAQTEHAVVLRDEAQCAHRYPDGTRCGNRRWLHLHHKIPFSSGGPSTVDNLTTMCSAHHRIIHAASNATRYSRFASTTVATRAACRHPNFHIVM
jgi:hypothetical protein